MQQNWSLLHFAEQFGRLLELQSQKHYEYFCKRLATEGVPVRTGKFRSHMAVSLVNDGPVTIWMDSKDK